MISVNAPKVGNFFLVLVVFIKKTFNAMKKLIYLIALLAATSAAEAQVIKQISPTKPDPLNREQIRCFTEEGAANYAKAEKMIEEKGNR